MPQNELYIGVLKMCKKILSLMRFINRKMHKKSSLILLILILVLIAVLVIPILSLILPMISRRQQETMQRVESVAVAPLYMFITSLGNDIMYKKFDGLNWSPWKSLGGMAADGPSATYHNGKIYVAVRSPDNGIWYGYIDVASDTFSGWIRLQGLTPSRPTIVATHNGVFMLVRGLANDVLVYPLTWENATWVKLGTGVTSDTPVATAIGSKIFIVVRGLDDASLWYGVLDTDTWTFSGWFKLDGATTTTPALCVDKSSRALYIAIKGLDDMVYINMYTESLGWHGWIPTRGLTDQGPAIQVVRSWLVVAVKGLGRDIWLGVKGLDGVWRWTSIDGLTDFQPTLVSTE